MRPEIKLASLIVIAALAVLTLHFTPAGHLLDDLHAFKRMLNEAGFMAPALFTLAGASLIAVGVPRLSLYFAGGVAFGVFQGVIWAQIASVIGSSITFMIARWGGRDYLRERAPANSKLVQLLKQPSITSIVVMRQLPIANSVINVILATSEVTITAFLTGSFIGFLPSGIVATLAGSGLGKESPQLALLQLAVGGLILLAAGAWSWRTYHNFQIKEDTL